MYDMKITWEDILLFPLFAITQVLGWLLYWTGDQRYTQDASGMYVPNPEWYETNRNLYFHRSTLRGCGCGYDGQYIYPSQCSWLAQDIRNGAYRGY